MEVKEMAHSLQLDLAPLIDTVNITGHVLGYGDSRLVKVEYMNSLNDLCHRTHQGTLFDSTVVR